MKQKRVGVYICHCGGNISDYVDVKKVRDSVANEDFVVVAKDMMFTCSDAAQQEMIEDIKTKKLNALVVASCSSKLHLHTFRDVARRAGMNEYQYVQVNIREQDSWTHTDDFEGATDKAIRLVKAGIAKARESEPLHNFKIKTFPSVLVIGGGISGIRASLLLSDLNLNVYLIEKEKELGGFVKNLDVMFPDNRNGKDLIMNLKNRLKERRNISVFTEAELIEKKGSVGNFDVKIKVKDEVLLLNVGAIIVATGFKEYTPKKGEYSFGESPNIITLSQYKKLLASSNGKLIYNNKEIKTIGVIHCVGSRQNPEEVENANTYCSRYCCTSSIHTSKLCASKYKDVKIFHFYRDIRTYGKYETIFEDARKLGVLFLKFNEDEPPEVTFSDDKLYISAKDVLTAGEEVKIPCDLVVLATGMVPSENQKLSQLLKIPIGKDGFFNEIHPKLKPVETVAKGVFIAGSAQSPKNSSESVMSSLSAVAKASSLLKKGYVELEPIVAVVDKNRCNWCAKCAEACPYDAIGRFEESKTKAYALINESICKGCGGCIPYCPEDAIDLKGYTEKQILSMIDSLLL